MLQTFQLQYGEGSHSFLGRLYRGFVCWPDTDAPYIPRDILVARGLDATYTSQLKQLEDGDMNAIWGDTGLMDLAFRPE